jgi:phage/plasmid-like protein (TIGR03299 family)
MVYFKEGINPRLASPFAGVSKEVSGVSTSKEVLNQSGLNWRVKEKPICIMGESTPIDTHKAIVREDTGLRLGIVGKGYHPRQNSEVFAFADNLIGEGKMEYVGAGTFNDGKRIFVQCRAIGDSERGELGPIEVAKNDIVYPYFLMVNGHDGSSAVNIIETEIRVWCWNTLNAAINSAKKGKKGTCISIRHTKSMQERMEQAKETFAWATKNHFDWAKDAQALAQKSIDKQKQLAEYFDAVFQVVPVEATQEATTIAKNRRERLIELFETGAGNELDSVKGTAWAAVNAVTQYLGHESRTAIRGVAKNIDEESRTVLERQKRLESNIFGGNADVADRAFEQALALV